METAAQTIPTTPTPSDNRIEAEGLYADPIQGFVKLDEDEDVRKVEPAAPDFDL